MGLWSTWCKQQTWAVSGDSMLRLQELWDGKKLVILGPSFYWAEIFECASNSLFFSTCVVKTSSRSSFFPIACLCALAFFRLILYFHSSLVKWSPEHVLVLLWCLPWLNWYFSLACYLLIYDPSNFLLLSGLYMQYILGSRALCWGTCRNGLLRSFSTCSILMLIINKPLNPHWLSYHILRH